MRWVLWWPAVSCVGVGKRRKLRRKGGARGSAHRGGVHDGRGGRTTVVARSDRGTVLEQ
jgi:hypothetical protein